MMTDLRERLIAALAKPLPDDGDPLHSEAFNPWGDLWDDLIAKWKEYDAIAWPDGDA